jgi:4-hydroxy-2-oxoheptanedioate aldolase
MTAPENRFKTCLKSGQPQIGLWLGLGSAYAAEICATMGFDWVVVDGEHAPNDIRSTLQQLQAMAPYPVHPVVRPPVGATHILKQLLDIGVQTVLVPMVETAEYARELVAATRYPPEGVRGVATALARAARWNAIPDYVRTANEQICLLVQVESRRGLENLDAIAAVPGVDGVFIGPSDLAADLGHPGNIRAPEVVSAIEDAIKRIRAAGKAPGFLETDPKLAHRYLSLGCTFLAVGLDIQILTQAGRRLAEQFKNASP